MFHRSLKAGTLSKITYIRTEDIDYWTVFQSDSVVKVELSWCQQYSTSVSRSDLQAFYSRHVSTVLIFILSICSFHPVSVSVSVCGDLALNTGYTA